ncbi:FAD-dependent oxidoreductase [Pendulispora rubella]|uniref:FAD-dependent oxidoreductase n=1 Tax=Pendulispora rubella TaxID=2741070 RepID=A0ABZ2KUS6_9BACT
MPRTRLFQQIQRALRASRPSEPQTARPASYVLGRRQLLRGLGLSAGALALSSAFAACRGRTHTTHGPHVVVVGAGLAGLTAAYRLAQRGRSVDIYEANHRTGGRVYTLHNHFATKVELGGEFIDTQHFAIRKLVGELGLNLVDREAAAAQLDDERYLLGGERWSGARVREMFGPITQRIEADRVAHGAGAASYASNNPVHRELDHLSISEWCHRNGFDGPARTLLELSCLSEFGCEPSEQSYLNLLYEMSGNDLADGERFVVKEGSDAIARRLEERLPNKVHLEHRLQSVRLRADGRLDAIFDANGRTTHVSADEIVLAIPFTQLRKCDLDGLPISMPQRRAIETARYGTNSKVVVGMSSRPWVADGASGDSLSDDVYHLSYDASQGFPTQGAAMVSFTGGHLGLAVGERDVRSRAEHFVTHLERAFPGSRAAYDGKAVRMVWGTARHFEGSYMCYAPGDWTGFAGAERLQAGNVHFAGEHTGSAQGYMEGAVDSGERAAAEILRARA